MPVPSFVSLPFQTELINKLNLGGGMMWAVDLDDFKNLCGCGKYPLLTALNRGLGRGHGHATDCTWAAHLIGKSDSAWPRRHAHHVHCKTVRELAIYLQQPYLTLPVSATCLRLSRIKQWEQLPSPIQIERTRLYPCDIGGPGFSWSLVKDSTRWPISHSQSRSTISRCTAQSVAVAREFSGKRKVN